jgi:hypothetical protein
MARHPEGTVWFCATPQGNKGPFDEATMLELLRRGSLNEGSYIWREGMDNWQHLGKSGDFDQAAQASAQADAQAAAPPQEASASLAVVPAGQSQDDYLDGLFIAQVKRSWERHQRRQRATEVDEVLVGGVITACLDSGYQLIDLNSNGTHHHLRFEQLEDGARVIFQLEHMAESLLTASVLGHEAQVVIGYGERVRDFGRVWKAIKQEIKGGYITRAEPGILTIDGDLSSQYIYVQVSLLWDIQDYLKPEDVYRVNYPRLTQDVGASLHALRKYLRGRFQGPAPA